MAEYQNIFWGYELTYPDDWTHQSIGGAEGFAAGREALEPGYEGPHSGHLLVSAEWNAEGRQIEPIWKRHLGMVAGMIGAKKVGSAPWQMGGGLGFEAEIMLPKRDQMRLWAGILAYKLTVLKFVVQHPLEDRAWFEPAATDILKSLRFVHRIQGLETSASGLPLPPGYSQVDPREVIPDIAHPEDWRAYQGSAPVDGLQAFYVREAPVYGWELAEYVPFPADSGLGFARLTLRREGQEVVLGILPYSESQTVHAASPARLVVKITS